MKTDALDIVYTGQQCGDCGIRLREGERTVTRDKKRICLDCKLRRDRGAPQVIEYDDE